MDNKDPNFQMTFAFIDRQIENSIIQQRLLDGYINGTAICKSANKLIGHYLSNKATKEFLDELSSVIGIPITELIQIIQGGDPSLQGTWVHPYVATNLAQWASAKIAVKVSIWVTEWMNGSIKPQTTMPYHLQRYLVNAGKIPHGYFSILNEITYFLIAPLEKLGYTLPENIVPDISEGKYFFGWLRDVKRIDTKTLPKYPHEYANGKTVDANLYPDEYLPEYRKHFSQIWLLQKAQKYFAAKDKTALPYLQQMILQLPKADRDQIKMLSDKSKGKEHPNDDFDKGVDTIMGFSLDEV